MDAPFDLSIKSDLRAAPGSSDPRRHFAELLDEARLADRLGYREIWTTEQHGWDDGYLGAHFPALAAFATATERLRVGTGILALPYYKLRQVLENAVLVDAFSGGRLSLGIGAGVYPREFELFGADKRRRGRTVEEGVPLLRQGLTEGVLPDGPGGELVPLTPRPVQPRVPILLGGLAEPAVDRAVRLGDGYMGSAGANPEGDAPETWEQVLRPALERHGRSLDDFRFVLGTSLWVTDDPERDWAGDFGNAFRYQQGKYVEAFGDSDDLAGASAEFDMRRVLIGTVDELADRIAALWRRAPFHELGFYHRLPGVPHERALEHLELVATRLAPAIAERVAR